ncbi:Trypsin-like peptidase domain protein [anaerobic digester metagenome]
MKSQEDNYKMLVENMEPINLTCSEFAQNKQDAIKAVVTIKKDKAHGSGCIISKDGYIISNLHVTGDDESKLKVLLGTGEELPCKIIRSNPRFDLALLKIDPVDVKPLHIVVSKEIEIGEDVYAIGTPADIELGQSITKGIISGKRKNDDQVFIQTDVSVNPGNSGGALINEKGELLGIINAKLFGQGIEGIGFAIPAYIIEEALKITN